MKNHIWHIVAALIVGVWGLTFISTKVLIESGMSPQEIFFARFLIAYVGIWFISPRKLFAYDWKDELLLLASGVTGGSGFFLAQNVAIKITLVSNVSFIVCTAPLLTTILALLIYKKEKATRWLVGGSLIALLGVA
ncbi:EamA family transporter, partial [Bacteroides heparinolyticus]